MSNSEALVCDNSAHPLGPLVLVLTHVYRGVSGAYHLGLKESILLSRPVGLASIGGILIQFANPIYIGASAALDMKALYADDVKYNLDHDMYIRELTTTEGGVHMTIRDIDSSGNETGHSIVLSTQDGGLWFEGSITQYQYNGLFKAKAGELGGSCIDLGGFTGSKLAIEFSQFYPFSLKEGVLFSNIPTGTGCVSGQTLVTKSKVASLAYDPGYWNGNWLWMSEGGAGMTIKLRPETLMLYDTISINGRTLSRDEWYHKVDLIFEQGTWVTTQGSTYTGGSIMSAVIIDTPSEDFLARSQNNWLYIKLDNEYEISPAIITLQMTLHIREVGCVSNRSNPAMVTMDVYPYPYGPLLLSLVTPGSGAIGDNYQLGFQETIFLSRPAGVTYIGGFTVKFRNPLYVGGGVVDLKSLYPDDTEYNSGHETYISTLAGLQGAVRVTFRDIGSSGLPTGQSISLSIEPGGGLNFQGSLTDYEFHGLFQANLGALGGTCLHLEGFTGSQLAIEFSKLFPLTLVEGITLEGNPSVVGLTCGDVETTAPKETDIVFVPSVGLSTSGVPNAVEYLTLAWPLASLVFDNTMSTVNGIVLSDDNYNRVEPVLTGITWVDANSVTGTATAIYNATESSIEFTLNNVAEIGTSLFITANVSLIENGCPRNVSNVAAVTFTVNMAIS